MQGLYIIDEVYIKELSKCACVVNDCSSPAGCHWMQLLRNYVCIRSTDALRVFLQCPCI